VRGFFENGGRTCYVVRAAVTTPGAPGRASAARLALPGVRSSLAGDLRDPATAGSTGLVFRTPPDLASTDLVVLRHPGLRPELHVIASTDGAGGVRLGGKLRATYPAGTRVEGYRAAMVLEATSPGNWGNRIRLDVTVLPTGTPGMDFALRVTVEPGPDRTHPREEELYTRLSLERDEPEYAPNVVNARSRLVRITAPEERKGREFTRVPGAPRLDLSLGAGEAEGLESPFRLEGGRDGLADVSADDLTGRLDDLRHRGLRLLEEIDEVSILCVPDAVIELPEGLVPPGDLPPAPCAPPAPEKPPDVVADDPTAAIPAATWPRVYYAMFDQCERLRDRVAIIDAPSTMRPTRDLLGWRDPFTSRFGALYCPWLRVADPLQGTGRYRPVPPSGHVAGVYARIDNLFGVHRPPANATLDGVADLAEEITARQQEELNPRGVNVLRAFPGRGIRVWGARSLAGLADADWRFIHVRRLMAMIEESIDISTQWTVFEPNDERLRRALVHSISVFLSTIWQRGGLKGNTPAEGFFVKCDETNNPPAVVDAGQLVCQVGVAVAAPMEFLVFEIRQKPEGAQVVEL
jgi:hypothetical protein